MNLGLIGYGFMGGAHAAAIAHIPGTTLAAVASRTPPFASTPVQGNLHLRAEPLPEDVRWTQHWQDVVDDTTIDAVDICLPTPMHRMVIERALRNGKHVLCEKPMAPTTEDCEAVVALAKESAKVLMIAHVLRWMQPYTHATQFVRKTNGIRRGTLRRSTGFPHWSAWLRDRRASGGAMLDLLCHDLDQSLAWFGPPASVSAVSLGEVDTVRTELRYSDGKEVIVEGGWLAPETPFSASFALEADDASLLFAEGRLTETCHGIAREVRLPERDPYRDEIAYFLDCCRTGQPPALSLPEDSAKAVTLALLLEESRNRNGKEIAWQ